MLLAGVSVGYVGDVTLRRDGYLDVMLRIDDQYTIPKGSMATVKPDRHLRRRGGRADAARAGDRRLVRAGDTVPRTAGGRLRRDHEPRRHDRPDGLGARAALQTEVIEAGTLKDMHKHRVHHGALGAASDRGRAAERKSERDDGGLRVAMRQAIGRAASSTRRRSRRRSSNVPDQREPRALLGQSRLSTNTALRKALAQMQNGNGTIGKLLTDSLLYTDIRRLLQTSTR